MTRKFRAILLSGSFNNVVNLLLQCQRDKHERKFYLKSLEWISRCMELSLETVALVKKGQSASLRLVHCAS